MEKTNKKGKIIMKYGFFAFLVTVVMLAAIIPQVAAQDEEFLKVKIKTKNKVTEGKNNIKVIVAVKNLATKKPANAIVTATGLFNGETRTNNKGKAVFYYTAPMTDGYPEIKTIHVTAREISASTGSGGTGTGLVWSGEITLSGDEERRDIDFGFIPLYTSEASKNVLIRPILSISFQATNTNVDRSEMLSLPVPSIRQAVTVLVTSHGKFIDQATVKLKGDINSDSWPLLRKFDTVRQQSDGGRARFIYTIPNVGQTETYNLVFVAKKKNYSPASKKLRISISP